MPAPAVKGYMPLCVTPRSRVCDEQGVGQWPMWKRFENIKGIVDQIIDEQYRHFFSLPYHEIDKLKAEELFYWYTPRCDTSYVRMSRTGDDRDYYKDIFNKTLLHYQAAVEKLKQQGKADEANFLQLSLKYAGESEDNIYCGDGRVIVTVWGMRPRQGVDSGDSKLFTELVPEVQIHTIRYELGSLGKSRQATLLKKSHGTRIYPHQIPQVEPIAGYEFVGWDHNPIDAVVKGDMSFSAQYREVKKEVNSDKDGQARDNSSEVGGQDVDKDIQKHHVRFLTPDHLIIKELDVEHGEKILPGDVPQLPSVDGVLCPTWDGNPLNDLINADTDYTAIRPHTPEAKTHTVRFLTPDGREISQATVEHGTPLSSSLVPPLPVVNGKVCPSWNSNPIGEVINSDRDFVAQIPPAVVQTNGDPQFHTVRFLNSDGSELFRTEVQHGGRLQPNQIPEIPYVDGQRKGRWVPNPIKHIVNKDTDFSLAIGRSWKWPWSHGWAIGRNTKRGFWKWLLYILLLLLLVFLVLYIMYLCDPCSK